MQYYYYLCLHTPGFGDWPTKDRINPDRIPWGLLASTSFARLQLRVSYQSSLHHHIHGYWGLHDATLVSHQMITAAYFLSLRKHLVVDSVEAGF